MAKAKDTAPLPETEPQAQSELGRLQAQVSTRRVALADLDRQVEQRTKELAKAEKVAGERLSGLRERIKEAEAALNEAHAELDATNMAATSAETARRTHEAKALTARTMLAEAEDRLTEIQAKTTAEADADARLATLRETLDKHEAAIATQEETIVVLRAEEARANAAIAGVQDAHVRRVAALREREDDHAGQAAALAHNKEVLEQYATELEQREIEVTKREAALTTAQADLRSTFDKIRADRQEYTAEATRLNQAKQALDVIESETAKTHQAAQEALAEAIQARAEAQGQQDAAATRSTQTEAAWLEVRNAERGLAQRVAEVDAREKRLREVSLKLAGSAAELKQAAARQKLSLVIPDVEA